MSLSDGLEENLCPVSHLPPLASFSNSFPLLPISEEADVQKGMTVLLVKSFALTNVFTGQAAIPPPCNNFSKPIQKINSILCITFYLSFF